MGRARLPSSRTAWPTDALPWSGRDASRASALSGRGQRQYARQLSENCLPWSVRDEGDAAVRCGDVSNSTSLATFQCPFLARDPR